MTDLIPQTQNLQNRINYYIQYSIMEYIEFELSEIQLKIIENLKDFLILVNANREIDYEIITQSSIKPKLHRNYLSICVENYFNKKNLYISIYEDKLLVENRDHLSLCAMNDSKLECNLDSIDFDKLYTILYCFNNELNYINYNYFDLKYILPEVILERYNNIKLDYDFGYNNLTAYTKIVEYSDNEYSPELTYYFKVIVRNDFNIDISKDKIYTSSQNKECPIINKEFVLFNVKNNIYDSYPIELNNYLIIKEGLYKKYICNNNIELDKIYK